MRIRKLEILGFKSFAENVALRFSDGVTGVVGPNGCGKSNVVDALRWVMGEQSAKHLRGAKMQDVIFAGSDVRGPSGFAEVSVTFENDGEGVPVEYSHFSEIQVTRRLYRDGDSDYEINRNACRLKDITELFLGTGIGTKAYSIIEQGQVATIVKSKPEERRRIIEEAAGITKYKARKQAAERKMDATNQNLLRITDVIREVQRRLSSLQRQAKKAEKYKDLKDKVRDIELMQGTHKWFMLQNALMYDLGLLDRNAEDLVGHEVKVATLEASIETERLALAEDDKKLSLTQARLYELDNQVALAEKEKEHAKSSQNALVRRREEALDEVAGLEETVIMIEDQREDLLLGAEMLTEQVESQREMLEDGEARLAEMSEQRDTGAQGVDALRSRMMAATAKSAEAKTLIDSVTHRRMDLEERRDRLESSLGEERTQLVEAEESAEDLGEANAIAEEEREDKSEQREALKEQLEEALSKKADVEEELDAHKENATNKKGRLTSLLELEKSFARSPEGVRHILQAALDDDDDRIAKEDVVGTIADLLEASPDVEGPLEAALGELLSSVVLKDKAAAERAKTILAGAEDSAIFYVEEEAESSDVATPNKATSVWEKVKAHAAPEVVKALLGQLFVLGDDDDAFDAWAGAREKGATLITHDGNVLYPDGKLKLGNGEGGNGLLQQKREIRELEEEVLLLDEERTNLEDRQQHLADESLRFNLSVERLGDELHELEIKQAERRQGLARAQDDVARLRQRIESVAAEKADLDAAFSRLSDDLAEAQESLADAEEENEAVSDELGAREENRRSLDMDIHSQTEMVTSLKIKVAEADSRQENLQQSLKHHAENRANIQERLERLHLQAAEADQELKKLVDTASGSDERIDQLIRERKELSEGLEANRAEYEKAAEKVRAVETELRAARAALDDMKSGQSGIAMRIRERQIELGALQDRSRDSFNVEIESVLTDFHMHEVPDGGTKGAQKQIGEIRKQMDALGEINLGAIDECKEYEERFEFLKAQSDDLTHALTQLEKAIIKINRTTKKRFGEAFEQINEHFQKVFPRLFRGGHAALTLTDPTDLLGTGVDIAAQPPGKKNGSITLLSGGEQALTAVSLIFAIFLLKPSPFCLLDEVDAPLDEGNVVRYSEMVKDMSSIAQFIVITHNKRTMEVADQLYGVTMEEPGVSKMVNVRMHENVG
ncbi:MAG: chromosome segregation protein SMC [Deltaproteobacteria bacterium]|nr:chromosome segregation protein SMC [Deltaproteobacteria bacterium]